MYLWFAHTNKLGVYCLHPLAYIYSPSNIRKLFVTSKNVAIKV